MRPVRTIAAELSRERLRSCGCYLAPIAVVLALLAAAPGADASKHRRAASGRQAVSAEVKLSERALVGAPVRLRALAPADRMQGALTYLWVWGEHSSEFTSTTAPEVTHVFNHAGAVLVALLITDSRGDQVRTHRRVVVESPLHDVKRAGSRKHAADPASRKHASAPAAVSPGHSAASATVAIKDFSFGPGTITIHVGDTVTWVNQGPSSHTATASGGFDTGVLSRGQSASHLFTSAGTFSYICSIHPFMHASVVVLGSTAASQTSEGTSSSEHRSSSEHSSTAEHPSSTETAPKPSTTAASGAAEASPSRASLPNTGMNVIVELLFGLGLLAAGLALLGVGSRRRARHK
jgi:LPXTG-motif cell wall-anchored protein